MCERVTKSELNVIQLSDDETSPASDTCRLGYPTEFQSLSLWRDDMDREKPMSGTNSDSDSVDVNADDMPEEIASNSAYDEEREEGSGPPLVTNADEKSNVGRTRDLAGSIL